MPASAVAIRAQIADAIAAEQAANPLTRLRADLAEAEAREAQAAAKAQEARQAKEDAGVRDIWAAQAKAAGALQTAILAYVEAYQSLVVANSAAITATAMNRRARSDLVHAANVKRLTAAEITRASAERHRPPGADETLAVTGDPRKITPMLAAFENLTGAIIA